MKPMKMSYDRAGDILIIQLGDLSESPGAVDLAPGVYVDVTDEGKVLAIEVLDASAKYPPEQLAAIAARYTRPMTLLEAASVAQTTSEALYKAIQRKRLVASKQGRDWYVEEKALEAYLHSRKHEGPGSAQVTLEKANVQPAKAKPPFKAGRASVG